MNKILKLLLVVTPFSIVGCADMLEASQNLRESLNKTIGSSSSSTVISETPSQICQAYRDNSVNASRLYKDKRISFKAKALSISGDEFYGGAVTFKIKDTKITFVIRDVDKISKVVKGKTYTATGTIHQLQNAVDSMDSKIKCDIVVVGDTLI